MLLSKCLTSQTSKQIIAIHILHNISRRKSNQATKFGHFIEHNIRIIFLQKSNRKYGGEASPRSFF